MSGAGFQPSQRVSAFAAAKHPDLGIGEVPGNPGRDLEEFAVRHRRDPFDAPVMIADELHMLQEGREAIPSRE